MPKSIEEYLQHLNRHWKMGFWIGLASGIVFASITLLTIVLVRV